MMTLGFEVQDKLTPADNCPWCAANGQANVLRSYSISKDDRITLCSSPQCLFPLVSRPLEAIQASLTTSLDEDFHKRKIACSLDEFNSSPSSKRLKSEDSIGFCMSDSNDPISCEVSCPPEGNNTEEIDRTLSHKENALNRCLEVELPIKQADRIPPEANGQVNSTLALVVLEEDVSSIADESADGTSVEELLQKSPIMDLVEPHLFWKNEHKLCWLDVLLVALVQCKTLKRSLSSGGENGTNQRSSHLWSLCSGYDDVAALVKSKEQVEKDNVAIVSRETLQEVENKLSELRSNVFKLLKPKMKCTLGQEETPVIALPLLLKLDHDAQDLFLHSYQWEFECDSCGHTFNNSVEKVITTFTHIMPDWHPLNAAHRSPCSHCHRKNQKRKMVFERLPPVFVLHFVEGLPQNDVTTYSFSFKGSSYAVTAVIQYNNKLKHFIAWIRQPDGSWLEFDDLKHPHCVAHKQLNIPAKQIHVVFWEAEFSENKTPEEMKSPHKLIKSISAQPADLSLSSLDDTVVVEALTLNKSHDAVGQNNDTMVGSTTLLDAFESLSHNDIVTLTLVEVNVADDDKGQDLSETTDATLPATPKPQVQDTVAVSPVAKPPKGQRNKRIPQALKATTPKPSQAEAEVVMPTVALAPASESTTVEPQITAVPVAPSTAASLSFLLRQHPSVHSTPVSKKEIPSKTKVVLKSNKGEISPVAADVFSAFTHRKGSPTNQKDNPVVPVDISKPMFIKPSPPPTLGSVQKPSGYSPVSVSSNELQKISSKRSPGQSLPENLSSTDVLRLKLMKKLKAKKKKLAKLNQLLGSGETTPRPDSTELCSPSTVSSSTYDSPGSDQFFNDLLSPTVIPASNLSPDSTGLMETLANGSQQNSKETLVSSDAQTLLYNPSLTQEDFFSEFIGVDAPQAAMESTDFSTLDLFF
uniref:USP domain-containing protein n=1 Tax=Denticeps clupeoides TaxID=299321 RepID=A0AAY4EJ14_9TELE